MSGNQLELNSSRLGSRKLKDENGNTMPAHSDDEVTPRRGLDEGMSEHKLKQLDEDSASADGGALVQSIEKQSKLNQGKSSTTPRRDKQIKDDRGVDNTEIMSDLNEREDFEITVLLQPDSHKEQDQPIVGDTNGKGTQAKNTKLMPTPRLFLGLDTTGKGQKRDPGKDGSG